MLSLGVGAELNCFAQKGRIWKNKGRREERSWDRGRLYAEMHPFAVTFNIQLSLLMASIFGANEFWSEISKRILLLQTVRSNTEERYWIALGYRTGCRCNMTETPGALADIWVIERS